MVQDNASQGTNIPVNASDEQDTQASQAEAQEAVEAEVMSDEEIAAQDAEAAQEELEAEVADDSENSEDNTADSDESANADNAADNDDQAGDANTEETESDSGDTDKKKETDWKDAYVRLAADFDNYRKRTSKEFDDVRRRERERVVGIWLEVYDNAERALASMAEKSGPWYEGFSSLIQQMDKCLATLNIKPVEDVGQKFDPKRHEAIATMADPSKENNTILYVERRGFEYENGDIARIARVIVVKNPS